MKMICAGALASLLVLNGLAGPSPVEIWKRYDPDAGDFREEIISEETTAGIYHKQSYISAYVNGAEIRVYCKYAVKTGARNAPGLMDVHGWMGAPRISADYVQDGWAVLAHDYCGKSGNRPHYTKYPEALRHGNMDAKVGFRIKSKLPDGSFVSDARQTDDYLWYAVQRRALSYLLAQKEVDASRIGAKGYSYGGTIMWNLGMDSRVKATVAYFGIGWLEYYRTRSVWMYNTPYRAPAKNAGEDLYLSAIAPQAHAPYITAASLWLNGTNDHHGGHERGEQTFKMFKPGVPWDFAHQARGHHNTEKLGDDCRLWLDKHVLGKPVAWPARPRSRITLDAAGQPEYQVTPASPENVESVQVHYCLKNANNIARSWRDAETRREGDSWGGKMPVIRVDDYVFGFATIRYKGNIVVSSDFEAAIPAKLGNAVATDTRSDLISEGTGMWSHVAPVEGVGGVQGFRALRQQGTQSEQFADPKWRAPAQAQLSFGFYCTQPQSLLMEVNGHFHRALEITASDDWQRMVIPADQVLSKSSKQPMGPWSDAQRIRIKSHAGSDITKVIFADFKWIAPPAKTPAADKDGKVYLTHAMAAAVESYWRVLDDKGVEGKPIRIGGKQYARGLGVHANSKITFPLDGQYSSFHVVPGPDDAHKGQIEMKILVDGKTRFASGLMSSRDTTARKPLAIPVSGAKTLSLIVTDGDGNRGGDHASWGDAYLSKE
jgi:dienelactone hydrolase